MPYISKRSWRYRGLALAVAIGVIAGGCGSDGNQPLTGPASEEETGAETADKPETGQDGNTIPAETVAEYDGGTVSKEQFDTYLNLNRLFLGAYFDQLEATDPNFHRNMLNRLIAYHLLMNQAAPETVASQQAQAERDVAGIKENFTAQSGSEQQWSDMLKEIGVSDADLMRYIQRTNVVQHVLQDAVSDTDLREAYDAALAENPNAYDYATVSHILVVWDDPATGESVRTKEEALERAKEVKQKLEDGGDFAELAKQYSDDTGSKNQGGTYEDRSVNDWVPAFKQAVLALPIDEISEPVESRFGYHIMQVGERYTKSFEQMESELLSGLIQQRLEQFMKEELPQQVHSVRLDDYAAKQEGSVQTE